MMHPNTSLEFISEEVGFGVLATQDIARGNLVWIKDPLDQIVSHAWLERMGPQLQRFLYTDHQGYAILLWDHARYVNHACAPNTAGGRSVELSVALRDIHAGEEITEDYRELPWFLAFDCSCGAVECSRRIEPQSMVARSSPYEPLVIALRDEALSREYSASQSLGDASPTIGSWPQMPQTSIGQRMRWRHGHA